MISASEFHKEDQGQLDYRQSLFNSVLRSFRPLMEVPLLSWVHACALTGALQFVHPKGCGTVLIVDLSQVRYIDAELVSRFHCDHIPLRGRAEVRDGERGPANIPAAVGLHHSDLLVSLVPSQLDLADQWDLGVDHGEGHPGVDVVVAGLQDSQPNFVVGVDVPLKGKLDVPLQITGCRVGKGG